MSAVKEARGLLESRLAELEQEGTGIKNALNQLDFETRNGNGPARRPKGRRPGRPKKRGSTTRKDDVLKLVKAQPGIQTKDIAKRLKIKPNYLYRLVGDLEKEKAIKKDGRKLYAA